MSLRAYAKRRGCTLAAVQKALAAGRLEESVVIYRRQPAIGDPDLADREWADRTRPRSSAEDDELEALASELEGEAVDPSAPDAGISYNEARRRREVELWRQARSKREVDDLDLAVRRGELVTAREAAEAFAEIVSVAKTKLLGLPARIKQRLPHVATDDIKVIDDLMREALEGLAAGDDDEDDE